MDNRGIFAGNVLLNVAVILAGFGLALIFSVRHAHWGPEGPVGAWLILVPYLFISAAVTAILIVRGSLAWVPGGRWTAFALWLGLLVAFMVSGYYAMEKPETNRQQLIALSGWLLLGGCFVAVNLLPSTAAKAVVVATLGLGGVAGWVQVGAWLADYSAANTQLAESKISNEQEYEERRNAEFRALGKDAPLWNYFGYMYLSNEPLRNECHEIIANRADRDASLNEYLGNEMLAPDATRYIGEFHPAPGPVLAPAFALRSDLLLSRMAEDAGRDKISDRDYDDIRDLIRAAARIQKGGGELAPQMLAWRNYLERFKNAAELVAEIDKALPGPGTR